jgi:hypothetical protein
MKTATPTKKLKDGRAVYGIKKTRVKLFAALQTVLAV